MSLSETQAFQARIPGTSCTETVISWSSARQRWYHIESWCMCIAMAGITFCVTLRHVICGCLHLDKWIFGLKLPPMHWEITCYLCMHCACDWGLQCSQFCSIKSWQQTTFVIVSLGTCVTTSQEYTTYKLNQVVPWPEVGMHNVWWFRRPVCSTVHMCYYRLQHYTRNAFG